MQQEELKRLPRKVTREMRSILWAARKAKFNYNQTKWFCGTSRCVAGEKVTRDAISEGFVEADKYFNPFQPLLVKFLESKGYYGLGQCGTYARKAWGLTNLEANRLFGSEVTLEEQYEMIKQFEAGKRVCYSTLGVWIQL